jgi:hypothetical protein
MRTIFLSALAIVLATFSPHTSRAQSGPQPEILVIGTYHMANPGHDLHNMQADDVLSPKRQQEIAQLIAVLKLFNPTKVAIEDPVGSERPKREYSDYLAGKFTLSRDESHQIGYRLAKELGHPSVYPVDEEGDFPWGRVLNYAKANEMKSKFDAMDQTMAADVQRQDEFLRTHTILETLLHMNSDSSVARDVAEYYEAVPFGDPNDYAGPDLIAAWFQRNIRIYHNIVKLIESHNDRVLVIYGAGHLGWLQQDVANDATVKLRKLSEFVSSK